jgi:hypothetical protein
MARRFLLTGPSDLNLKVMKAQSIRALCDEDFSFLCPDQ